MNYYYYFSSSDLSSNLEALRMFTANRKFNLAAVVFSSLTSRRGSRELAPAIADDINRHSSPTTSQHITNSVNAKLAKITAALCSQKN